eukprot:1330348-Rhodomonas_salina.1
MCIRDSREEERAPARDRGGSEAADPGPGGVESWSVESEGPDRCLFDLKSRDAHEHTPPAFSSRCPLHVTDTCAWDVGAERRRLGGSRRESSSEESSSKVL